MIKLSVRGLTATRVFLRDVCIRGNKKYERKEREKEREKKVEKE